MTSLRMRRLQGLGLFLGIGMIVSGALFLAYVPVEEARIALREAEAQIERFRESLSRDRQVTPIDVSALIRPVTPAAGALQVQRALVDLIGVAGLSQQELRVLPEGALERGVSQLSFSLVLGGDLDQWTKFMRELGKLKPAVLVDRITLVAGSAHRGDLAMRIEMQLSAYVREPFSAGFIADAKAMEND